MTSTHALPPDADVEPAVITSRSGSNLIAGFACLDAERRDAMVAIYAFCRVVDDAVDDAPDADVGRKRLAFWRDELAATEGGAPRSPVGRALQQARQRFDVPQEPLQELSSPAAVCLNVPRKMAEVNHISCLKSLYFQSDDTEAGAVISVT